MAHYTARRVPGSADQSIGILLIDYEGPFVHGDVGNAGSFGYPVLYQHIPGATSQRAFAKDPALGADVVAAALALERRGVRAISSDCGFLAAFQCDVTKAVRIPVLLSPLAQLPVLETLLAAKHRIGVIAANGRALTSTVLAGAGLRNSDRVVLQGLEGEPVFGGQVSGGCARLDPAAVSAELLRVAIAMTEAVPSIATFLIECSMLPPYSRALRQATGRPVFDYLSMIDLLYRISPLASARSAVHAKPRSVECG